MHERQNVEKETLRYFNGDTLATKVWIDKYSEKDEFGNILELSPDHMHRRLAKKFAEAESKYPNPLSEEQIYQLFKNFKYIVPQGRVMAGLGAEQTFRSLSNCLILPTPNDSYSSIMRVDTMLVSAAKRGCGYGIDVSKIRPKGSVTKNASNTSTGIVPFMERYSNSTREVGQDGRRGACLLGIDIKHPQSMDFVKSKSDKTKITGANISLKIDDAFFNSVIKDGDYDLEFKDKIYETIKASEYWNKIVDQVVADSEPGIFMWDRINNYDPASVYPDHKITLTNACFSGDELLLTANGNKTFAELSEQDDISIVNMSGEVIKSKVWCSGEKDTVKFKDRVGSSYICTPDQKWMLNDGSECEAQFLKGKRLMPFLSHDSHEDKLFVQLGFIQGDGSLGRLRSDTHKGFEINIGYNDLDVLNYFGFKKHSDIQRTFYTDEFYDTCIKLKFNSNSLPTRTLPETFNDWSDLEKKSFMKGLFSANGSVTKNVRVSFKATCKPLILQMSEYLKSIGIDSYYTTNKSKTQKFSNGEYTMKESYDLNIGKAKDVVKFYNQIGFIHEYKMNDLYDLALIKSPIISNVSQNGKIKVYDFTEPKTNWGVVNGYVSHNCGEQPASEYDSCRLIVLNLFSIVSKPFTNKASIDYALLEKLIHNLSALADDLVDLEIEYIDRIIGKIKSDPESIEEKAIELFLWEAIKNKAIKGRRVGMGITALGDMLAALGVKYGSHESMRVIDKLFSEKLRFELEAGIKLAKERGHFPDFNAELENDVPNDFYTMIKGTYPDLWYDMQIHGRRSINWSTIAPTGTTSLMTQTSSGCEPVFLPEYKRRTKVDVGSDNVAFVDDNGDNWQEHIVYHHKYKQWLNLELPKEDNPYLDATAHDLDPIDRVKIQAILQKYTTSAISSTINLKKGTTKEEVSEIYLKAWEMGCKGITAYIDGSRDGVMVSSGTEAKTIGKNNAPKRPKELPCDIYSMTSHKERYLVAVGILDGNPYEIFAFKHDERVKIKSGFIKRASRGKYNLLNDNGDVIISDFTSEMTQLQEERTRTWSWGLRHSAGIKFLVEQLSKSKGEFSGFPKLVARVLKKYIKDDEKASGVTCEVCGGNELKYVEGCISCPSCGWSKC